MKAMLKTCMYCGEEFEASHGGQGFCSDECRRLEHNRQVRERYHYRRLNGKSTRSLLAMRRCVVCGKEFQPRHGKQTICSAACAKERQAGQNREHLQRQKVRRAQGRKVKKCVVCGEEFVAQRAHQKTCSEGCRKLLKRQYNRHYAQYIHALRTNRKTCARKLLDYLERLEKTYGYADDGTIRNAIESWYVRRE